MEKACYQGLEGFNWEFVGYLQSEHLEFVSFPVAVANLAGV